MLSWISCMEFRIKGFEKHVPWFFHDKIECHNWCTELGVDSPIFYAVFDEPDSISLDDLPSRFALKPSRLSSTRGVMVLEKKGPDDYYDSMSRRRYSGQGIRDFQNALLEKFQLRNNKWIVEEFIEDRTRSNIPIDVKAYAFRGQVALYLVIDRTSKPSKVSWFDSDFSPLKAGRISLNAKYVQAGSPVPPESYDELRAAATRISRLVASPFARIDLYDSSRGPLLGEVTLTPGGLYYGDHYTLSPAFNRLLGEWWQFAETELCLERDLLAFILSETTFDNADSATKRVITYLMTHPVAARNVLAAAM